MASCASSDGSATTPGSQAGRRPLSTGAVCAAVWRGLAPPSQRRANCYRARCRRRRRLGCRLAWLTVLLLAPLATASGWAAEPSAGPSTGSVPVESRTSSAGGAVAPSPAPSVAPDPGSQPGATPASPPLSSAAPPAPSPAVPIGDDAEPAPAGWDASGHPTPATREPASPGGDNADAFGSAEELARAHVQQARVLFGSGQYDKAITELEAAYRLRPNSNYLFSIAQCHRRAGRNRVAYGAYERFLRADPNTALRQETQNYMTELLIVIRQEEAQERERKRPVWRKPWFWGAVAGSAAAAALALGIGLGVGLKEDTQTVIVRFPGSDGASAQSLSLP